MFSWYLDGGNNVECLVGTWMGDILYVRTVLNSLLYWLSKTRVLSIGSMNV